MTRDEINKLKEGEWVRRPPLSKETFLTGLSDRGKVVLRAPAGVWICWEDDPEREDQFYSFDDPYLERVHFEGTFYPGEPWLRPAPVRRRSSRTKGGRR